MKSIEEQTREAALEHQAFMGEEHPTAGTDFMYGVEWELNRDKWISVKDRPIKHTDMEVIAYHPNWIDEDFNPKGTRAGFMTDEGKFISSRWCDYQDCYIEDDTELPTHYMIIPEPPKQKEDKS